MKLSRKLHELHEVERVGIHTTFTITPYQHGDFISSAAFAAAAAAPLLLQSS